MDQKHNSMGWHLLERKADKRRVRFLTSSFKSSIRQLLRIFLDILLCGIQGIFPWHLFAEVKQKPPNHILLFYLDDAKAFLLTGQHAEWDQNLLQVSLDLGHNTYFRLNWCIEMIPEHTFTVPAIGWLPWEGSESSQEPATESLGMSNSEGNCGSCSDVKTVNAV